MTVAEYNDCVMQHADGVYRFILKNTRSEVDAQDIVQNAFEILWNKHQEVDAQKAKSYLFTVAYHNMVDGIRRGKKMDYVEEVKETSRYESNGFTGAKEAIERAMAHLPEIQRTVVMLRDYEGYAYDEIGTITGLTESQVKVYIFRARKKLQDFLVSIEHVI